MTPFIFLSAPFGQQPKSWNRRRFAAVVTVLIQTLTVQAQTRPEYEMPPLLYSDTPADNAATRLQAALENGQWQPLLTKDVDLLQATLATLQVPIESQVLVFSKTSLQRRLIHPRNPRALYFSDDCYVGWVPGGSIEIAVTDPRLGISFHLMTRSPNPGVVSIRRDPDCLTCHAGPLTGQWPGLMVRSVFTDAKGEPIGAAGSFLTTHESPISERWGGWYVTGQHGEFRHMGNTYAHESGGGTLLDRESGANLVDLSTLVPTDRYLRADSDLVALMILEHQVEMHNRLVRAGLRTRRWLHYQESLRRELGEPSSAEPTGSARIVIDSETNRILECLLYCREAPLPHGGLQGNNAFPRAFSLNKRMDAQGRSLKDLNLGSRLFRFRCSYMIYSQAFDALPVPLKSSIYQRLQEVLEAELPETRFAHLDVSERQAISEILRDTKPELAAAWSNPRLPSSQTR